MASGLLERDAELRRLEAAVDHAARGRGCAVLISGEAGIGKTSLVRAFMYEHSGLARVLDGACDNLSTPRTLGPFRDMARTAGGAALAQALTHASDRDAIFGALRVELSQRPTVMIVEDIHWADDATLDVLRYFARRIADLPSVLVLTYRDDEVRDDHPLQGVLGAFARQDVQRLALGRLSAAAVKELCAAAGADPDALMGVTGGNPFFLTEALASAEVDVPATVRDAVLARVRELAEDTQRSLELLSVIPGAVERWLAEDLLGERMGSLDEAERRGVLEASPERLWFRHELARRAITRTLSSTSRVVAERQVLQALERHPEVEASRLVHHALEANEPDRIIEHALIAAREATAAGAPSEALSHYELVLSLSSMLADPARATILEESAWVLYNLYRFGAAAKRAREAVELQGQTGDEAARGAGLTTLSRTLYMVNDPDGSEKAATEAVALLEPLGASPDLARAYSYLAAILKLTDRPDEAIARAHQALQLGERDGHWDVVAHSLNYLGGALIDRGDAGGARHLRRSAEIARTIRHHEYAQRAYTNLVEGLYRLGKFDELDEPIEQGLAYAREYDFASHEYNIEAHRCMLATLQGRWVEAEEGLRRLQEVEDPGVLASFGLSALGRLLARKGDAGAEELLTRAWRVAAQTNAVQSIALAGIARVEWAWLQGEHEAAREFATLPLARTAITGAERYRGELLRFLVRCGESRSGFPGCPPEYALGITGDWRGAAAAWESRGAPYEHALELFASGRSPQMVEALASLEALGASAAANLVRRELRGMGVARLPRRPQPQTRANPAGLTDRQVEVLALVAAGLTNAEIADQLVVSVRTVDHHVAAILEKLRVTSRREAARAATRLGITAAE